MPQQARFNMVIPQWLKDKAEAKAEELGISLAEYIKDLMKKDIR
jgi:predicted HicB family RNase H-like nuclease